MKTIIEIVVAIIFVAGGAYYYMTRPAPAPSETAEQAASKAAKPAAKLPAGSKADTNVFKIGTGSRAEFSIYELLNGVDKTVVGTTADIAGDIRIAKDRTKLEIGTVTINARTFKTDSSNRDGAISRLILKSDKPENEFITFSPSAIIGLPSTIENGSHLVFQVSGDLSISGVTKSAIFDVVMDVSEDSVRGTATTKIKRSDYNLVVPNLSFIANVGDEFTVSGTVVAGRILQ
jgi:polyisoprenoid-binding protein YceI